MDLMKAQIVIESENKHTYPITFYTKQVIVEKNYGRSSENESILSLVLAYNTIDTLKQPPFGSVDSEIDVLKNLLVKDGDTNESKSLLITWGIYSFRGVLKKIDVKYTMFSPDGTPLKADVAIQIIGKETIRY